MQKLYFFTIPSLFSTFLLDKRDYNTLLQFYEYIVTLPIPHDINYDILLLGHITHTTVQHIMLNHYTDHGILQHSTPQNFMLQQHTTEK